MAEFTNGQKIFIKELADKTGLDRNVVAAWVYSEENGGAAQSYENKHFFDWLNIGITDSGSFGSRNAIWSDPKKAADATAAWLKGTYSLPGFGKASAGIQRITRTVGMSPSAQIAAIQQSGWASSGYPNLPAVYKDVKGKPSIWSDIGGITIGTGPGLVGGIENITGIGGGGSLNPFSGVADAIKDFTLKFVYAMAILGGGLLVLLGLALMAVELGIDQAKQPRAVRATRSKLSRAGIKRAKASGYREGEKAGIGMGRTAERNRQSLKLSERRAKRAAKETEQREKLKESYGDVPY